jgi:hypothetical protein
MNQLVDTVHAGIASLDASGGESLRLTIDPALVLGGIYQKPLAISASVRASSIAYRDDPTRVFLSGGVNALRELGVILLLSALHGRVEQLVIPLVAISQYDCIVLEREPYSRGLRVEQVNVHEICYQFVAERSADDNELLSQDYRNPAFGFAEDYQHAVKMGLIYPVVQQFSGALIIGASELASLRLGRSILDLSHPSDPFRGSFSRERRRGETSNSRCSVDAEIFIAANSQHESVESSL